MKPRTIQTLKGLVRELKRHALYAGHYPPLYTPENYDKRGPVPFRSMACGTAVLRINALEDAIKCLENDPHQPPSGARLAGCDGSTDL